MCVAGRSTIVVFFVALCHSLFWTRTSLASALESQASESQAATPYFGLVDSSGFDKAPFDCNSITICSPRFLATSSGVGYGEAWLVLPLCSRRAEERTKQEPLQRMWGPLPECSMVAHYKVVPDQIGQQEEKGQTAEERTESVQGRTQSDGAFRGWGAGSTFGALGTLNTGSYSYSSSTFRHGEIYGGGRNTSYAGREENHRGEGSTTVSEADVGGQRGEGWRYPFQVGCLGEDPRSWSRTSANLEPSHCQPVAESREGLREHEKADHRARQAVEALPGLHPGQVQRAEQVVQHQTEATGREESRDQSENGGTSQGDPTGSGEARDHRSAGGPLQWPVYGHGDRPDRPDRYRGRNHGGSDKRSKDTKDEVKITFAKSVKVVVYDEIDTSLNLCFTVPTFGVADWDSKPWALHGGKWTMYLANSVLQRAVLERVHAALSPGGQRGDQLHHGRVRRLFDGRVCGDEARLQQGDFRGEGDCRCGGDGILRVPLRRHGAMESIGAPTTQSSRSDHHLGFDGSDASAEDSEYVEENGLHELAELGEPGQSCTSIAVGGVQIHMFGLDGGYLGQREGFLPRKSFESEEGIEALHGLAERLWPEHYNDDTTIVEVEPQPVDPLHGDMPYCYVIADFLPLHDHRHLGMVPIVFDAKGSDDGGDFVTRTLEAALVPERASWHTLVRSVGLQHVCLSRVTHQCLIRIGTQLVLSDEACNVPDGALLTFLYEQSEVAVPRISLLQHGFEAHRIQAADGRDDPIAPTSTGQILKRRRTGGEGRAQSSTGHASDDGDAQDPLQEPEAAVAEDPDATITFGMFHRLTDQKTIELKPGMPGVERRQIAEGWGIDAEEIVGIHPLRAIPDDLDPVLHTYAITRWRQDNDVRPYPTDVQCLFDIEIHSGIAGNEDTKLFRFVEWTRRIATRADILHYSRSSDYCRLIADDACLVWHNRQLWPLQDFEARPIRFGDYLKIAMPAKDGHSVASIRQLLQRTEDIDRANIVFEESEENDSSSGFEEVEDDSSGSTRYGPPPDLPEPEPHATVGKVDDAGPSSLQHLLSLHVHLVDADGSPRGVRVGSLPINEIESIVPLAESLWTDRPSDTHLTFLGCAYGSIHYAWAKVGDKVQLCSLHAAGPHVQDFCWTIACKVETWGERWLLENLPFFAQKGFQQPSFRYAIYGDDHNKDHFDLYYYIPNVCSAYENVGCQVKGGSHQHCDLPFEIERPRGEPIQLLEVLGNDYNPFFQSWKKSDQDDQGIDFSDIFSLLDWLDSSAPIPSWILPEGTVWHDSTQPWIELPWWNYEAVEEVYIYTDGSARSSSSSAAAVIFVQLQGQWLYGGYLRNELLGPPCPHRAELHGILLSCHWLNHALRFQTLVYGNAPNITIAFDATSAGYKAFGQWGGGCYPELVANLRGVLYFIEARFGTKVSYTHVRGHNDDPGNEAANTVAQMKTNVADCYSTWIRFFDRRTPTEVHWLWSLWKPEWFGYWKNGRLHLPSRPTTTPTEPLTAKAATTQGAEAGQTIGIACSFATANVLTLLPGKDRDQAQGLQGRARLDMLQTAFHDAGYHIVGVQESRLRKEVRMDQPHYIVVSAPATSGGHGGTQLWFSKNNPVSDGCYFQKSHLRILARDPRILAVKVDAPFMRAIVISAHAPTSQSSSNTISDWWKELAKVVPAKYSAWPKFVLVDANARIGSEVTRSVGDHQPDDQDPSGEAFHEYMLSQRLWAPATFEECHSGPGGTWRHPRTEKWGRGDYVCLPSDVLFTRCTAQIDTAIDLSLRKEDHRVAAVTACWSTIVRCETRTTPYRPTVAVGDLRADLQGPGRREVLDSLSQNLPCCPWEVDVHSHTQMLQDGMQNWVDRYYKRRQHRPLRQHMTGPTWELVKDKKHVRNLLFDHNAKIGRRLLRGCFQAWATGDAGECSFLIETRIEARDCAGLLQQFAMLGRSVTQALRADDRLFFETLAKEAGEMDAPGKTQHLWKKIQWAFPRTRARSVHQPLMMEKLDDQWIPHFAKLEAGTAMSDADLQTSCLTRQQNSTMPAALTLSDLPTRHDVEMAMRRLSNGKAAGPDGLPSDLFKGAASILAIPVHDLFAKVTAYQTEPLQSKGGTMHPLYKRGDPLTASSYRGIMLLNVLSKTYHSWLRQQLMTRLQDLRVDTQIGGFRGQQATYGSQCLQILARMAQRKNMPLACIFIDVQGAYHFLVRELVMGRISRADEDEVLANLHTWKADTRGLKLWLEVPNLLARLGFPERLQQLLREVHCDTWARLPHIDLVIRTCRGSRPGSPLADAIFAILMADLHVEVYRLLESDDEILAGYNCLGVDPLAVTWADDLAIPVTTEENGTLVEAVRRILCRVHGAFENRGLLLNLSRGKTTAVLAFRGPGAPAFRKRYLLQPDPGVEIAVSAGRSVRLHFACTYRHLGMMFTPDGEVAHEIRCRIGQAKAAMHDMAKVLFSNRAISSSTRLRLFEALVVSRLCYGVSVWGHVPPALLRQVESFILRSQRRICGLPFAEGPQTDMMVGARRLPTLRQRLAVARLMYAVRVWTNGPDTLRQLIIAERDISTTSWWHFLEDDLEWCRRLCPVDFPAEDLNPTTLAKSWKLSPQVWHRIIKTALKKAVLQESTAAEVRSWHHECFKALKKHGAVLEGPLQYGEEGSKDYGCECGRVFTTIQGLTQHRRHAHGYSAPEAKFIVGPWCPHCHRYFWTRARVQQHLAYIPRGGGPNQCYAALTQRRDLPKDALPADLPSLEETAGINRRDAIQLEVPEEENVNDIQREETRLIEELDQLEAAFVTNYGTDGVDLAYVEEMSMALTRATWRWFEKEVKDGFGDEDRHRYELQGHWFEVIEPGSRRNDHEIVFVQWGREILGTIMAQWCDGSAEYIAEAAFYDTVCGSGYVEAEDEVARVRRRLQGFQQERNVIEENAAIPHRPVQRGPVYRRGSNKTVQPQCERYHGDDRWFEQLEETKIVFGPQDQPLPCYQQVQARPVFLILHLFSGRRRLDDIHHKLAHLAASQPFNLHILSLDTAVDGAVGNLASSSTTWATLERLLADGVIASGVAGPPCETWSSARYYRPDEESGSGADGMKWPRPLRDDRRPWGLELLTLRELRQLATGSALAMQVLYVMIMLFVMGGSFVVEHPGPSKEPWKASLFRTALVRALLDLPEIRLQIFPQGDWGAVATKPTGLLSLRMPRLATSMLRWRQPTPADQRITAIGRGDNGFKTAALKEYAKPFSAGIAQGVCDAVRQRYLKKDYKLQQPCAKDADWIATALQVSSQIRDDSTMRPDYQPQG